MKDSRSLPPSILVKSTACGSRPVAVKQNVYLRMRMNGDSQYYFTKLQTPFQTTFRIPLAQYWPTEKDSYSRSRFLHNAVLKQLLQFYQGGAL